MKCLKPTVPTIGANPSGWKPDTTRGTRHQRGYGWTWEKTRERVMQRDNGLCQPCLKRGHVTTGTEVDHITPKANGGTDSESNLQTICKPCHKTKTSSESRTGGG